MDFPGRPWQFDSLHLLELLQSALHLGGLPRLGAKAFHEAHLPLYLALLPRLGRPLDLQGALACYQVMVVVASQEHHLVRLDGENPGCHLVQESAVVRCDEHPALERCQVLLEPQVCVKVEVIGRLVEE